MKRHLLTIVLVLPFLACERGPERTRSAHSEPAPPAASTWTADSVEGLPSDPREATVAWLQASGRAITDDSLEGLVALAAEHRLVLLGESTHGTDEYYESRASITRALIEHGHTRFIAVEGDWTTLARLDAWARRVGEEAHHDDVRVLMRTFDRWPVWMWSNEPFARLVTWIREWNDQREPGEQVRIHGVDVYDAGRSMVRLDELLRPLAGQVDAPLEGRRHHPAVVSLLQRLESEGVYPCFARFREDRGLYSRHVGQGQPSCEGEVGGVVEALELEGSPVLGALPDDDARLEALMNALVVQAAEHHHRAMALDRGAGSWNSRAGFFFTGVQRLLDLHGAEAGAVFWAHNTHVGDGRATAMARQGEVNIGMQAREGLGADNVFIIGYAKRSGEVVAGHQWGGTPAVMPVHPPRPESWDELLAEVELPHPWAVVFRGNEPPEALSEQRLQRAIGVIFRPETGGAWVPTRLADRYDALIVYDTTTALDSL